MSYAQNFGKEFLDFTAKAGGPMNEEQSKQFFVILMTDWTTHAEKLDELLKKDFIYQIMGSRLAVCAPQVTVDKPAMLWAVLLAEGNPGNAVMLCAALLHIASENGNKVSLETMTIAMPMAVPNRGVFEAMWDKQKTTEGPSDNMLDNIKNWHEEQVSE